MYRLFHLRHDPLGEFLDQELIEEATDRGRDQAEHGKHTLFVPPTLERFEDGHWVVTEYQMTPHRRPPGQPVDSDELPQPLVTAQRNAHGT